jgi:hypothetical protein
MRLIVYRKYPVIDYQTMAEFEGHERLFRTNDSQFLLHMSSENRDAQERIVWLSTRDAILWLNDSPNQFGSFWGDTDKDALDGPLPSGSEIGPLSATADGAF